MRRADLDAAGEAARRQQQVEQRAAEADDGPKASDSCGCHAN